MGSGSARRGRGRRAADFVPVAWRPGAGLVRFLTKLCNALLVLLGLGMMAYGLYIYIQTKGMLEEAAKEETSRSLLVDMSKVHIHYSDRVSIYALLGAGCFTTFTGGVGIYGAQTGKVFCLNLHACLLFLMLVAQGAVVGLVFTKHMERPTGLIPHGKAEHMYDYLKKQNEIIKYVGVGALGLQVLCVMLTCCTKAMLKPESDYDSDDEWDAPRRRVKAPLLPQSSHAPGEEPGKLSPWSQRMREKYGLDTSQFRYQDEREEEPEPKRRGCTIM
mmetsp:Transcript_8287/g.23374  ORF Transcript_8287/g.23374 Transcript_8287/m.23374 type:complete len:274 (-) Transcript_8287:85-906(-)